jgi:hypothetical protein
MARRGGVRVFRCATQPCTGVWQVRYDSLRELREMNDSTLYKGWKCSQHSNPKRYLTPDNPANQVVFVATEWIRKNSVTGADVSEGLRWVREDKPDSRSSTDFSSAHYAEVSKFPVGTRLVITAYTETPEQSAIDDGTGGAA